ncbi:unnamed protein product [Sphagnum jensenii]|uniref:AB hydrolase-1 domain-containing protein n=1 Tax=Sphagnum jensenii TaxID=128206 RepID=A0ABP1AQE9_9BRYO
MWFVMGRATTTVCSSAIPMMKRSAVHPSCLVRFSHKSAAHRRARPLSSSSLSRSYTAAAAAAAAEMKLQTKLVTENQAEAGQEVIGECQLQHGEILNGDIKIHYVECGKLDGDLVLLLHGFPNFWYVWKNQFQPLAEAGFHVIAPDMRGYNTSSKPTGVASYGRQPVLSDVVCIIDHFGAGKRAIVVRHDWGGAVAWALAEDYPSKLTKIVVVNSAHLSVLGQLMRTNFQQLWRTWYILFFQLSWLPEFVISCRRYRTLRRVLELGPCRPQPAIDVERHVMAFSEKGAVQASINYYRAGYQGLWGQKPGSKPGTQLPVGIIWGEADQYLINELAEPPEALATDTSIMFLPKCSHWPMWDEPDHFNQLLLSLLSSDTNDRDCTSGTADNR